METADLSHHISRRFNEDLERVRSKVLGMGGFVEQQLQKAISALVEGDSSLGERVATDDYQVNNMEVAIDDECCRILATRAPTAGDLRVISPQGLTTIAGPSYPEIRLALAPGAGVARELKPSAGTPSPRPRGSSPASRRYRRRGAPGWP